MGSSFGGNQMSFSGSSAQLGGSMKYTSGTTPYGGGSAMGKMQSATPGLGGSGNYASS